MTKLGSGDSRRTQLLSLTLSGFGIVRPSLRPLRRGEPLRQFGAPSTFVVRLRLYAIGVLTKQPLVAGQTWRWSGCASAFLGVANKTPAGADGGDFQGTRDPGAHFP